MQPGSPRLLLRDTMNRSHYFDYCAERLTTLAVRIEMLGKSNILHLNLHSETFYLNFFNLLYGYSLANMNAIQQNAAAIDLIDSAAQLVVQVSATAAKSKIESALSKDLSAYAGHQFKFILIARDGSTLRQSKYKNPHALVFSPTSDIYDVPSIVNDILHLKIDHQKEVYELIKAELGVGPGEVKEPSNLAAIIALLAQEDFTDMNAAAIPFSVDEKIVFNNLSSAKTVIEDYKIFHSKVSSVYAEFDRAGKNKSFSVLQSLRAEYQRLKKDFKDDELFFAIVDAAMSKVVKSGNYTAIAIEELELCIKVIVVDAFIRCKIFENPSATKHAVA